MAGITRWTVDNIPDLSDKIAVVTGANSGIGFETARELARKSAHVVMTSRSQEKGDAALREIRSELPQSSLDLRLLDLADLASIRAFAEAYAAEHNRLDMLINNAGVMAIPYRETVDGFEMQFGTNHLGHFALTGLLLDVMLRTPASRIVTVSSGMHRLGKINFDDLHGRQSYDKRGAYAQSKLANLLFAFELQRRLSTAGSDVTSVAAHPGYAATNLQTAGPQMEKSRFQERVAEVMNSLLAQSAEMGALPTLYAATASDVEGGDYIGPGGLMEMRGYPQKVEARATAHDRDVARRLWEISESLTGVTYPSAQAAGQEMLEYERA